MLNSELFSALTRWKTFPHFCHFSLRFKLSNKNTLFNLLGKKIILDLQNQSPRGFLGTSWKMHKFKKALELCYPNVHFLSLLHLSSNVKGYELINSEHTSFSQGITICWVICHVKSFELKFSEIIHSFLKNIPNQFSESFVSNIYEYFLFFFHGFVRAEMSKKRMIFKIFINKGVSNFFQFVLSKISF